MITQTITTPVAPGVLPGQNGWPLQDAWRYEDYLHLPDDGRRYEIIKGVLYVANASSMDHQFTVFETSFHIKLFIAQHNLGLVYTAPVEVHLTETSRPVQPDIMFIRAERQPRPGTQFFEGAPDLIVEVISPSSIRLGRIIKFDAYENAGVAEYWLADPKTRSVEVYTLSRGEYALLGQYTGDEKIQSNVLEGIAIITRTLFYS